jgi:hypothetical protein
LNIPRTITAGDSITWSDAAAVDAGGDPIDSSDWTLRYYLRTNAASEGATVTGSAATGGGWDFTIAAATSTAFDAGTWHWQAQATYGSLVTTLGTGPLRVLAALAYAGTPAALDGRSQAEKDLEAVQAAIRTIVEGGITQYAIGSRQATKLDLGKLMERESCLKGIVARERAAEKVAAGLGDPRNLFVRFGS